MRIIQSEEFRTFRARQESQWVCPATDYLTDALERLRHGTKTFGDSMPWTKTQEKFRFRPGEVTIWAGTNGSGKSMVTGMQALWLASQRRVLIASLEMPAESTVARMGRQYIGTDSPTDKAFRDYGKFIEDGIWLYDQVGTSDPESILAMIHWGAEEHGVTHFFIDSLMKCVKGTDDFNGQKNFVDAIGWAAKEHKVHVHLVHHVRKPDRNASRITKYDVKGAGEITDLADNVILVSRKKPEELRDPKDPSCFLEIAKQRHGEWEGTFGFWWDERSMQWTDSPNKTMRIK